MVWFLVSLICIFSFLALWQVVKGYICDEDNPTKGSLWSCAEVDEVVEIVSVDGEAITVKVVECSRSTSVGTTVVVSEGWFLQKYVYVGEVD